MHPKSVKSLQSYQDNSQLDNMAKRRVFVSYTESCRFRLTSCINRLHPVLHKPSLVATCSKSPVRLTKGCMPFLVANQQGHSRRQIRALKAKTLI